MILVRQIYLKNNMNELDKLIEESKKLSGIFIIPDNWEPKVGDWVVITKSRHNWDDGIGRMDAYIDKYVKITKTDGNNIDFIERKQYSWNLSDNHFRPAHTYEIPNE